MGLLKHGSFHMKIRADILTKLMIATTPPSTQQEASSLFRRRLAGMTLPILKLENLRLARQRRSISKKLFLDGVIIPYYLDNAKKDGRPALDQPLGAEEKPHPCSPR
jgi:hypothetical protein